MGSLEGRDFLCPFEGDGRIQRLMIEEKQTRGEHQEIAGSGIPLDVVYE
jgi:hypothetical protein